ncbi:DUF4153 domain-containing protein [Pragia fontium]|uniref:DUF4153 domain-containing protein n=1 Tax=Pragia fontium TaxID=82985 RepID=A0ABQ5LLC7_9GAMM|nr:DUF4153 domain-containing protein [Pragia fontium]GKX63353.1 DUF4153 domain-containing protein [Pragia fontium]
MVIDTLLPKLSRWAIVLVCLLQGILIYLFRGEQSDSWLVIHPAVVIYGQTLSFVLPTILAFSIVRITDSLLWRNLAICSIVALGLATWFHWNMAGLVSYSQKDRIAGSYYFCLGLILYLAMPWLQTRIKNKQWIGGYSCIYDYFWGNTLTLIFTLTMMGVFWGILRLGAELFGLVDIYIFQDLFFRNDFVMHTVNGFIIGIGILTCRIQIQLTKLARNVLSAIVKGFLPLLSSVALLFIITLPFIGLNTLSGAWSAAGLLTTVVFLLTVSASVVYQSGLKEKPYPTLLRMIVNGSLLVLPAYALLALYSVWLRIVQYGWTPFRVWGGLIVLMATAAACCYAFAVIRSHKSWLKPLGAINKSLLLTGLALLILVNTPLLDPYRISVNGQMARYTHGVIAADDLDLVMLRFDNGRRGEDALRRLQNAPDYHHNSQFKLRLENVMSKTHRWEAANEIHGSPEAVPEVTIQQIQQNVSLANGTSIPDESWWHAVLRNSQMDIHICLREEESCVVASLDLNTDGDEEYLLCHLPGILDISCYVFTLIADEWHNIGYTYFPPSHVTNERFAQALRAGEINVRQKEWGDLDIDGEKVHIYYPSLERQ